MVCGVTKEFLTHDNRINIIVIIMVRTQISLDEGEYELAKEEAERQGISLAEFFRRSLRLVLPVDDQKPWMRYAGLIETGDEHSSERIDDVIYGQKD